MPSGKLKKKKLPLGGKPSKNMLEIEDFQPRKKSKIIGKSPNMSPQMEDSQDLE